MAREHHDCCLWREVGWARLEVAEEIQPCDGGHGEALLEELRLVAISVSCCVNVDITNKEDSIAPTTEGEESLGDGRNFILILRVLFLDVEVGSDVDVFTNMDLGPYNVPFTIM